MPTKKQTDSIPQKDNLVERNEETLWIWEDDQMIEKTITFVPLLYQIFDKILISAADRKGVKDILVKIDVADKNISVWNHGDFNYSQIDEVLGFLIDVSIQMGNGNEVSKEVFNTMGKKLKEFSISEKWCMVTCQINLAQFGMECLEHDIVALMKRRVVDLAGCCSGVKVQLDGTHILPRTFEDYVELYLETSTYITRIYEKVNDRWEICVAIADGHLEHSHQVSFVNNIPTMKGGSHVDYITSLITDYLAEIVNLQPNEIKRCLWVFVNAHFDDPTFDSQTKEKLTTNEGSFGSTCKLTPEFLKKIADSLFEDLSKKKSNAGKLNIPKLQDAKLADTPYSQQCTLILTRGYFATDFVTSRLGQEIDKYGLFPLEGNLINVREAGPQELEKNTDIQNIKKILGLQDGKIYENVKELRYGHLMIMVNEDHDGSRIKGLLINFLHYFWPSLLKVKKFMQWFVEPIVKASHKRTNKVFLFYTMSHYLARKKKLGDQFNITSYKELETIESEEGGEYNFDEHIKYFVWDNDEDGDAIELAFSNMKIEERKHWLQAPPKDLDLKEKDIPYRDFMNKEFKQYAMADLQRSIPSMVDGLKPRKRKILFYALKKPIIQKIKVTEFSIYVLNHSPYHDGVVTLVDTIIGMAQNYVGSNNINLLESKGEFGTRWMGGKDHARCSPLAFHSALPITKYLFHKDDEFFFATIGMRSTGAWSSFIPNYNPRDVIANLERLLAGEKMVSMLPCFNGVEGHFKGSHFEITMTKDQMNKARQEGNKLKLTTTLSTANMYVLDAEGKLKKYDTPEKLVEDFYRFRLHLYEKRKTSLPHELKIALLQNKSKERFARAVRNKELDLEKPKSGKCVELKEKCFKTLPSIKREEPTKLSLVGHLRAIGVSSRVAKVKGVIAFWAGPNLVVWARYAFWARGHVATIIVPKKSIKREAREETPPKEEDEDVAVKGYDGYDYLISQLDDIFEPEYIEELEEERKATDTKLQHLTAATPESLWLADLAALDAQLALVRKTFSLLIL
ncbi:DNA topoisomerase 2 [Tanacetum coccineum]